jgi:hypothetical protein
MANLFSASPATGQQIPTLTPQQLGVKGQVSNQALQMLQGLGGGNFNFEPIAQQARTQFQTQTVPGLAERFTSLGSGAQRSSAFQGALGQAGAGLEEGLGALRSQYGLQQQGLNQNLLQMLLGHSLSPEADTLISQGEPGLLQELGPVIGQLLPYLPALIGSFFGPAGTAAGAGVGAGFNALKGLFSGGGQRQQTQTQATSGANLPNYSNLISNIIGGR